MGVSSVHVIGNPKSWNSREPKWTFSSFYRTITINKRREKRCGLPYHNSYILWADGQKEEKKKEERKKVSNKMGMREQVGRREGEPVWWRQSLRAPMRTGRATETKITAFWVLFLIYIYIVLFSLFLDPTKEENSSILFLVLFFLVPIFPLWSFFSSFLLFFSYCRRFSPDVVFAANRHDSPISFNLFDWPIISAFDEERNNNNNKNPLLALPRRMKNDEKRKKEEC